MNDLHLPMLIKSTLSDQNNALPWNNLDQLSCLWAVFTKYKRNIRDGFRLENLSWRLWYRQSVLQKKVEPKTSEDINFTTATTSESKQLTRTRSMPDLSQWSQQKSILDNPVPSDSMTQKFFISADEALPKDETNTPYIQDEDEDDEEDEDEEEPEEQLVFTKKSTFDSFSSTLSKPVSLLSDMLQRTESNVSLVKSTGLRRCQSRYCRLDQFFLNAS